MELDLSNTQQVAREGDHVVILNPRTRMTQEDALILAAWLVAVVGDDGKFTEILREVRAA